MTILIIALLVVSLTMTATAEEDLTAKQIVDKSYEVTKLAGTEATSTMTIFDGKGHQRVRKIAQVSKLYDNGETEKKLIRFLSPADVKGTSMLTYDYENKDDDMWLYMPALRKTRRIVSSEKSKSFMGSEFSYSDMSPPVLDDFNYKLLGEEEVDGVLCYKVEIVPKDYDVADENGFSKKISFIDKSTNVTRRAIYYDLDDEMWKELTIHEIKLLDPEHKKYRATNLEMVNKLDDRRSTLVVNQIVSNPDVKDEYFTTRYLERP